MRVGRPIWVSQKYIECGDLLEQERQGDKQAEGGGCSEEECMLSELTVVAWWVGKGYFFHHLIYHRGAP